MIESYLQIHFGVVYYCYNSKELKIIGIIATVIAVPMQKCCIQISLTTKWVSGERVCWLAACAY